MTKPKSRRRKAADKTIQSCEREEQKINTNDAGFQQQKSNDNFGNPITQPSEETIVLDLLSMTMMKQVPQKQFRKKGLKNEHEIPSFQPTPRKELMNRSEGNVKGKYIETLE